MSINTQIVLGLVGFGCLLALIAGAALLWLAIKWSQDTSPDGDGPWEAPRRAHESRQYAARNDRVGGGPLSTLDRRDEIGGQASTSTR
jgi:hypothetical protein